MWINHSCFYKQASRGLANLDREAVRETFYDGVHVLHPRYRSRLVNYILHNKRREIWGWPSFYKHLFFLSSHFYRIHSFENFKVSPSFSNIKNYKELDVFNKTKKITFLINAFKTGCPVSMFYAWSLIFFQSLLNNYFFTALNHVRVLWKVIMETGTNQVVTEY